METPKEIPGFDGVSEDDRKAYLANYGAFRVGISSEDAASYYNGWATKGTYETDLNCEVYKGPSIAADALANMYDVNERFKVRVLDVGAGTGLVGEYLHKHGFLYLDALDPAESMLDEARQKGVYTNFICDFVDSHKTDIADGCYDAVVSSGAFGEGHIPCDGLQEIARVTKPGGVVVIAIRQEYLSYVAEYKDRLEPRMMAMQEQGIWTLTSKYSVNDFAFKKGGIVFIFRKC